MGSAVCLHTGVSILAYFFEGGDSLHMRGPAPALFALVVAFLTTTARFHLYIRTVRITQHIKKSDKTAAHPSTSNNDFFVRNFRHHAAL